MVRKLYDIVGLKSKIKSIKQLLKHTRKELLILLLNNFFLGTIRPPATVPNGNVVQADSEENRNNQDEPLPPGWEMRYDSLGRRYYVDHNTRFVLKILEKKVNIVFFYILDQHLGNDHNLYHRVGKCEGTKEVVYIM